MRPLHPWATFIASITLALSAAACTQATKATQIPSKSQTPAATGEPVYAPSPNPPLSATLPADQQAAKIPYPRFAIPVHADRPTLGPDDAPVTIEIFSDFECPYCAQAQQNLDALDKAFPGSIRRVYRAFPLSNHPSALYAALIAESAAAQGKFWPFYRAIFSARQLRPAILIELAMKQGLDLDALQTDLQKLTHAPKLRRDLALAKQLGVNATPILYINGRRVEGSASLKILSHYVEQELRVVQSLPTPKNPYLQLTQHGYTGIELPPEPPPATIPTEGAPSRGSKDAPVTIVVFSDFECPFCVKGNTELQNAIGPDPSKVRLVFRHMPLPFHAQGKKAARIGVLAQEQQKFWLFHDRIFSHTGQLDDQSLIEIATRAGLSPEAAQAAIEDADGHLQARVDQDIELGHSLGIRGTPAYFINGKAKRGVQPSISLSLDIDAALHAK